MRIAELDRKITIQQRTAVKSPSGQNLYEYQDLATVWAKRTEVGASEGVVADAVTATLSTAFIIRYRANVNEQCIVVDADGGKYNVTGVTEHSTSDRFYRKRFLILRTSKHDTNGRAYQF